MASWQHYVTATATCLLLNLSPGMAAAEDSVTEKGCRHGSARGDFLMHKDPRRMLEFMTTALDLTAEQQARIKAEFESTRETRRLFRAELRSLRQQLREAAEAGASQAEIESLAGQLGDLMAKGAMEKIDALAAVKGILTPEQVEKMDSLREMRRERFRNRFSRREKREVDSAAAERDFTREI